MSLTTDRNAVSRDHAVRFYEGGEDLTRSARFVIDVLRRWACDALVDDALLVVSGEGRVVWAELRSPAPGSVVEGPPVWT